MSSITSSPLPFRTSPDIPTASSLKEIIDNDQWDNNALIVFHDGKYFGVSGTSATPTSISQISVASSQQHQQDQSAHAVLTKEIKELFATSSSSDKSVTPDSKLDASLSHFLATHLHHLTKSSLVPFLQDQGYTTMDDTASQSSSVIPATTDDTTSQSSSLVPATTDYTTSESPSPVPDELPLATAYTSLSPLQQEELNAGKTVVVKHRTTDPELLKLAAGRLRGLMPTFTAYKLTDATSEAVADALWTPTNAANVFPLCEGTTEGVMTYPDNQTVISESTYLFKAAVPGFSRELEEHIPFRAICLSHNDNSQEVSFENTQATDNINKVKGRLQAVPHADKTLASLDLFIDLKGMLLPRFLPDKAIRVATKLILRNTIEVAEESK